MRLVAVAVVYVAVMSSAAHACSWPTPSRVTHGYSEAALPPEGPAPDLRFEGFERFPGIADTSCSDPVAILKLSVSPHYLKGSSLSFESLASATTLSPIDPGSYTTDALEHGRLQFTFVTWDIPPGRLALRAFTVSPSGRRSKDTLLVISIPPGGF